MGTFDASIGMAWNGPPELYEARYGDIPEDCDLRPDPDDMCLSCSFWGTEDCDEDRNCPDLMEAVR
jgi:hypothetical protein